MEINEEIMSILKKILVLEDETLDENRNLEEIGLDSVNLVDFVVSCEKKFNIEIEDEDLLFEKFSTIERVRETIRKYLGK